MARRPPRTAPLWVREMDARSLHGLAGRLIREHAASAVSERQDWLLSRVLEELEHRRRRTRPKSAACSCWLCVPSDWF